MKKILLLFLSCFSCTIAEAQTTPPYFKVRTMFSCSGKRLWNV